MDSYTCEHSRNPDVTVSSEPVERVLGVRSGDVPLDFSRSGYT